MAETIQSIAKAMVAPGKGILAADESTATIQKRFDVIKVEVRALLRCRCNVKNVEANRQAYRELLFTTPDFEKYISGVILFEETLEQKTHDGTPFAALLKSKGTEHCIRASTFIRQA
jgi:fructose-bisphosphate aldolase class I